MVSAYQIAASVPDPELPMVTVADLGILRDVREDEDAVTVIITPTYSGCPALREIGADLRRRLAGAGYQRVDVRVELAPAWTWPSRPASTRPPWRPTASCSAMTR